MGGGRKEGMKTKKDFEEHRVLEVAGEVDSARTKMYARVSDGGPRVPHLK